MARPLRRYRARQVFEITSRTVRGRYLFAPSREMELEWAGILSEACRRWPTVKLHMITVMSNHQHALISSHDANAVARWASFVFASTAWLAKAYHRADGVVWERRYRAIPILDDASLRARVKYVMAQACAADLVTAPRHWPGLNSTDALCRGKAIMGSYVNAKERQRAQCKKEGLPLNRVLELAPLPGLPDDEQKRRTWFRTIEKEIIEETRERHRANGTVCPSPESYRQMSADFEPKNLEKTPAPRCHASCKAVREAFFEEWEAFARSWREALEEMKHGRDVSFPAGSWWPFDCHVCVAVSQLE